MTVTLRVIFILLLGALLAAAPAAAQQALTPQRVASLVKEARAALTAGRPEDAVARADQVLEGSPGNRDAAAVKIDALGALRKPLNALDAYEAFIAATKREDLPLVGVVARAELQALTTDTLTHVKIDALAALARAGDPNPRSELVRISRSEQGAESGRLATIALGAFRDQTAARTLRELAATGSAQSRIEALEALGKVDARAATEGLQQLLNDPDPSARMQAMEALSRLDARSAIPQLKAILEEQTPYLRLPAAVALKRLGDASSDALVRSALDSPVLNVRLLAAQAYAGTADAAWILSIRPILQSGDIVSRLAAAELLLPHDRTGVLAVLKEAAADTNPIVRSETARILSEDRSPDVALLRPLLRDKNAEVRLQAARGILDATRAAATKRPAGPRSRSQRSSK
jgi:HEAT repeat protein